MNFVDWPTVVETFRGKRVAIVGSGPGSLENAPGLVDGYDVVVRVNNYKTGSAQGHRCDVYYSFFGTSIKKSRDALLADGVKLCISKLPNGAPIDSAWHKANGKTAGIDYRYVYRNRAAWWPCPVYVPDNERFLAKFDLLGQHQPTTGFAAILDVLACEPAEVFLTGFDMFTSGVHNVDEKWKPGNPDDPHGHRPDLELQWLRENSDRITADARLTALLDPSIGRLNGITDKERTALSLAAALWNVLIEMGEHSESDMQEHQRDIHDIQHRVMARVARRLNPDFFR